MKVKAPKGYHWMKDGKEYKLMKNPAGGYKPHKGASQSADFKVQKVHKGKQEAVMAGYSKGGSKQVVRSMPPKKKKKKKKTY